MKKIISICIFIVFFLGKHGYPGNTSQVQSSTSAYTQKEIPELVRLMKDDPDKSIKGKALEKLGEFGETASNTIPDILTLRQEGRGFPFFNFFRKKTKADYKVLYLTLQKIGPDCIPYLIEILKTEKCPDEEFSCIISTLAGFGWDAHRAVPVLMDRVVSYPAFNYQIARIAPRISNHQTPYLSLILEDRAQPKEKRFVAAITLGYFADPSAVPALLRVLVDQNDDETIRVVTVSALGEIGGPTCYSRLKDLFQDEKSNDVKRAIILALGKGGKTNENFVLNCFKRDRSNFRKYAVQALMDVDDPGVINDLLASLKEAGSSSSFKYDVLLALSTMVSGEKFELVLKELKTEDQKYKTKLAYDLMQKAQGYISQREIPRGLKTYRNAIAICEKTIGPLYITSLVYRWYAGALYFIKKPEESEYYSKLSENIYGHLKPTERKL